MITTTFPFLIWGIPLWRGQITPAFLELQPLAWNIGSWSGGGPNRSALLLANFTQEAVS